VCGLVALLVVALGCQAFAQTISGSVLVRSTWEDGDSVMNPPGDGDTNGNVVVGCWSADSTIEGVPLDSDTVYSGPMPPPFGASYGYNIAGPLTEGAYLVIGWVDADGNGAYDLGEPRSAQKGAAIGGTNAVSGVNMTIVDDLDEDKLPDWWEAHWFRNASDPLASGTTADPDNDGLDNATEYGISTAGINMEHINPANWDSDGDGMDDKWEYNYYDQGHAIGLNPTVSNKVEDVDGDGLSSWQEYCGVDGEPVMLRDRYSDGVIVGKGSPVTADDLNPLDIDTDIDMLVDSFEAAWYDPSNRVNPRVNYQGENIDAQDDTDRDGLSNYREQCLLAEFREGAVNGDKWVWFGHTPFPYTEYYKPAGGQYTRVCPMSASGADLNLGLVMDLSVRFATNRTLLRLQEWTDPTPGSGYDLTDENPWPGRDTDGDLLPDGWEVEFNLDPRDDGTGSSDNGTFGDPDGDGIDNWSEYLGQDGDRFATHPFINGTGDESNPNEYNWRPDSTYYWRWYETNIPHSTLGDPRVGTGISRYETLGSALPTTSLGVDDGWDSDDDGLPDWLEFYSLPGLGLYGSSPVNSCDPFQPKCVMIRDNAGIAIPDPEPEGGSLLVPPGTREDLQRRSWTIECQVKPLASNLTGNIFNFVTQKGAASRTIYRLVLTNNLPVLYAQDDVGMYYVSAANALPTGQWTHLAGVWDHQNNKVYLYVQGVLAIGITTYTKSTADLMLPATNSLVFGSSTDGSFVDQLLLDEIRIWGTARSWTQIANNAWRLIPQGNGDDVWLDDFSPQYYGFSDRVLVNGGSLYEGEQGIALTNVCLGDRDESGEFTAGDDVWIDNGDRIYNKINDTLLVNGGNLAEGENGVLLESVLWNDKDGSGSYNRDALLAYYRFDDGGTSAEDFARKAKNSLKAATAENYLYGDRGYALPTNNFMWITNDFALVRGVDDFGADDTDNDGMPDGWEQVNHLDPNDDGAGEESSNGAKDGPHGALGDEDGDGLQNLYEFWSRSNPRANDSLSDFDEDSVAALTEQKLGSRPDLMDTDDDGLTDDVEQEQHSNPADPADPAVSRAMAFGGGANDYLEIPVSLRQSLTAWTLEAWVYPSNAVDGVGVVVRRAVQQLAGGSNVLNYVLGLESDGAGGLRAYAGFISTSATYIVRGGSIEPGTWTHLAASYSSPSMVLYTNGIEIARSDSFSRSPQVSGRGGSTFTRIGEDFGGRIDEVRIWSGAKTAAEVMTNYNRTVSTTSAGLMHYFRFDDGEAVTNIHAFSARHIPRGAQDWAFAKDWNDEWRHAACKNGNVGFVEPGGIVPPASLRVVLQPVEAVAAGAQWALTDIGSWNNSGVTVYELAAGPHSVIFKSIAGWTSPSNETVVLTNGSASTITRTYLLNGSVRVTLSPADALAAGAQWRLDGNAWQDSEATISNVSPGVHSIEYKSVDGWGTPTPSPESVTLVEGQAVSLTRSYNVGEGCLIVVLGPAEATAAGAQWRVDGGSWQNSGVTNLLRTGTHTVDYYGIPGWRAPVTDSSVVILSGQTNTLTRYYEVGTRSVSGTILNNSTWDNLPQNALPPGDGSNTGRVSVGLWYYETDVAGAPITQYTAVLSTNALPIPGTSFPYVINEVQSRGTTEVPGYRLMAWVDGDADGGYDVGEPRSQITSFYMADDNISGANLTITDDQDVDALPDWWEAHWFGNLLQTADGDYDLDRLLNGQEYNISRLTNTLVGLNPASWDSDGDSMDDWWEYQLFAGGAGLNPTVPDAFGDVDGDGLSNLREYRGRDDVPPLDRDPAAAPGVAATNTASVDGLNPLNIDTDGDGLIDSYEFAWWSTNNGLNPLVASADISADPDMDGLTSYREQCLLSELRQGGPNDIWSNGTNDFPQLGADGERLFVPALTLNATNATMTADLIALQGQGWTDPTKMDTDSDLLPDGWEVEFNLNPVVATGGDGADGDPDGDSLLNIQEYYGQDGDRSATNPAVCGSGDETNPNEHNWRPMSTGVGPGTKRPWIATDYWVSNDSSPADGTLGAALPTLSLGMDNGEDTDDDGIWDNDEIQGEWTVLGIDPSPVHSMSPFVKRAALITGTNGIPIPDPEGLVNGYSPLLHARDWTLECYVKLMEPDCTGYLINIPGPFGFTDNAGERLALSNNVPTVSFHTRAGLEYKVVGTVLPTNRWIHLAGVWNHGENYLSLYVDGVAVQGQRVTEEGLSGRLYASADPATIGKATDGSFSNVVYMDEVRIWGAARSSDDIETYRRQLVPQNTNGLRAYYRFDDGGTTAEDFTRKASSGLLGAPDYMFGDRGYALQTNGFIFVTSTVAFVYGVDARGADDTDGDGMPDAWEVMNHLDPYSTNDIDGASADADGDGLHNIYEYWADTNPWFEDTDQDSTLDSGEDRDGDGVVNIIEQQLGSRPDIVDTDDDGLTDKEEQEQGFSPADSVDPALSRAMSFGGARDDFLEVPIALAQRLSDWTLEAWVEPGSVTGGAGVIVRRVVQNLGGGTQAVNYVLGLETNVGGRLQIYAGYIMTDGRRDMISGGDVPTGTWTHIAATYNSLTATFTLYTNGYESVKTNSLYNSPPVNGKGGETYVRIGEDFGGRIDDVRIWSDTRSASELLLNFDEYIDGDEQNLVHYFRFDDAEANTNSLPFGEYHAAFGAEDFAHPRDWTLEWRHAAIRHGNVAFSNNGAITPPPALRVILQPSEAVTAGAQWSMDNGAWLDSGATVRNLSRYDLTHTIGYKGVAGWTAPTNETVTVSNGYTTALSRYYIRRGQITVTVEPPEVPPAAMALINDDHLWSIGTYGDSGIARDGAFWQQSGVTVSNLNVQSYTVQYYPIPGWIAPASASISLGEGEDLHIVGFYSPLQGYVRVLISPDALPPLGARWRVDSGPWRESGQTSDALTYGGHTIEFLPVAPWVTPAPINMGVTNHNQIYEFVGTYTELTGIYVELTPPEAVAAGAAWKLVGDTGWTNSGVLLSKAVGTYTVEFRPVEGWSTPPEQTVQVLTNHTTQVFGRYYRYEVILTNMVDFFRSPRGLAFDSSRKLYIADSDHHRIVVYDTKDNTYSNVGQLGTASGEFNQPIGVALDPSDNLYITDANNHRVQRRRASSGSWTVWGGIAVGTNQGQFNGPYDIITDSKTNIYVADLYNNRVQKRDSSTGLWMTWVTNGFPDGRVRAPAGVAIDSSNRLYVGDYDGGYSRVQVFSSNGLSFMRLASSLSAEGELNKPRCMTFGLTNDLFVADMNNNRIVRRSGTGVWDVIVGELSHPEGVAWDPRGYLYVADTGSNRVIRVEMFRSTNVPPEIASTTGMPGNVTFSWTGAVGWYYTLQYSDSLLPPLWLDVPGCVQLKGLDGVMSCSDTNSAVFPLRIYRMIYY